MATRKSRKTQAAEAAETKAPEPEVKAPEPELVVVEVASAPPKPSVLSKAAHEGPHGPDCQCDKLRFRLQVQFQALVKTQAEAKQIADMFAAVGLVVRATGIPTSMEAGIYAKPGDDGHEDLEDKDDDKPTQQPAVNLNLN